MRTGSVIRVDDQESSIRLPVFPAVEDLGVSAAGTGEPRFAVALSPKEARFPAERLEPSETASHVRDLRIGLTKRTVTMGEPATAVRHSPAQSSGMSKKPAGYESEMRRPRDDR
jgi:hypothetical protein